MQQTKRYLFLLVFCLFQTITLSAQQPAWFYLGKDEFEGVQIYDVIQDDVKNYWFATDRGFYKYDGYTFTSIGNKKIKGQAAFGFVKNKKGVIYAYNLNHQIIKIENGKCDVFYELKGNEKSADIYLFATKTNSLMVLGHSVLLFNEKGEKKSFKQKLDKYYGFPFETKNGLVISHILDRDSILIAENDRIYFKKINCSEKIQGVLKFFTLKNKIYAINVRDKKCYELNPINYTLKLLQEKLSIPEKEHLRFYSVNSEIWVAGTKTGVQKFNSFSDTRNTQLMFAEHLISDVYCDHEGNILLSTFNNGVIVIPDAKFPDVLSIENGETIVSVCSDSKYGILMGSMNGKLIGFKNNTYTVISNEGTKPLQPIFSFQNSPYILFDDGSVKLLNKNTGKIQKVHFGSLKDAAISRNGTISMALNVGVIQLTIAKNGHNVLNKIDPLSIRTNAIAIDTVTNNLFTSTANGLFEYRRNSKVIPLTFKNETVYANDIEFTNGKLYALTKNNGILVFENGKCLETIMPKLNGSNSEMLKIKSGKNKIYLNTSNGFFEIDSIGKVIAQLNKEHGFTTNRIYDFDVINNHVWMVHSKGVQSISMPNLKPTMFKPIIRFASIVLNDSNNVDHKHKGDFENNERKLVFELSSPTLKHRENILYHYTLEGYDNHWLSTTYSNNKIIYNALQPGSYVFKAKASYNNKFGNTIAYHFSIAQPFYFTKWFISSLIVVIVLVAFFIYRMLLSRQKKKALLINEINLSRLAAIQSQMNPHFIFNSLNAIQDLVLKGDIENSYTFITRFSDLIRRTLNYSDKDFIEFEEEIKLLELYLSLEKLRFKSTLNYSIDTENIDDVLIPPMLIQPFIENALLHGLLHKDGIKELRIRFRLEEQLVCIIEDNGIGREKAREIKTRKGITHESFSGNAIKKRFDILTQQFHGEIGFSYEDLPTGTKVVLKIPCKHKF